MIYNCLIVDDEPLALDIIENYVNKMPELKIVGKCSNAAQAMEALRANQIDLVFLDIQMPEITGLELLKSLKEPPAVIFTTAYSDYAIEGFELNAIDYLLKPISFDRFLKAVNKALDLIKLKKQGESVQRDSDHIFVKSNKKLVKVKLNDILYIEGLKDYVMIYTDQERIITLQTMKNMEESLPSDRFIRIHRSFIIAHNKIKSVVGNTVELSDKQLPIGKLYREPFMQMIEKDSLIR